MVRLAFSRFAMAALLWSLLSLCLLSFAVSSPCDTVVVFQCPTKGDPSRTTYLPMQCRGTGQSGWSLATETFQASVPYDDIQYNPISSPGQGGMIFYLTQDYPPVLLGFNLSNGGRQELNVKTSGLSSPFWMLQYPARPNIFLVMNDYKYGTLDFNTGVFTTLYDLRGEFEAVGYRQRGLSADLQTLWFEALYSFGQYKLICFNTCMVGVDPLTGLLKQVQPMDVEPEWISSSPLPPSPEGKTLDQFSSIFINNSDITHSIVRSGSIALPTGEATKTGFFSGPTTYTPQGDFDVNDGPFGQFYYVTNAAFPDRTKYYRQVDIESGEEEFVVPISNDSVRGLCDSDTFTTSAVTFVGRHH